MTPGDLVKVTKTYNGHGALMRPGDRFDRGPKFTAPRGPVLFAAWCDPLFSPDFCVVVFDCRVWYTWIGWLEEVA